MSITELRQQMPMTTPIGDAMCWAVRDYGPDMPLGFLCFVIATGEPWEVRQPDARLWTNISAGRTKLTPFNAEQHTRFAPIARAARALHRPEPPAKPPRKAKAKPQKAKRR